MIIFLSFFAGVVYLLLQFAISLQKKIFFFQNSNTTAPHLKSNSGNPRHFNILPYNSWNRSPFYLWEGHPPKQSDFCRFFPLLSVLEGLVVYCERFFIDFYQHCLMICLLTPPPLKNNNNNILDQYNVFGPRGPSSVP